MRAYNESVPVADVQFVSDINGETKAVIVPIELWREMESERETAYLLSSETMKRRLLASLQSTETIPFDEAIERLGL